MQSVQDCANPVLLCTTGSTSHTYMPTDKQIAQTADVWAFEAFNLGMSEPPPDQAGSDVARHEPPDVGGRIQ